MLRAFWTCLLLAVLVYPASAADVSRHMIDLDGVSRSYHLYVPETAKGPAPLLVVLHGSQQDGERLLNLWKDRADQNGFVLVAPNSRHKGGWQLAEDGPRFIQAVLREVVGLAPIDGRRIYLFGYSGGAVFALDLSMLESEFFAATAIHAGAWRAKDDFFLLTLSRRKIPLAIIVGDRDEFFSLDTVHKTETALKDAGFPVNVMVIPGHHHALASETAPVVTDKAWCFLSGYALDQPPRFQGYKLD